MFECFLGNVGAPEGSVTKIHGQFERQSIVFVWHALETRLYSVRHLINSPGLHTHPRGDLTGLITSHSRVTS